VHVGCGDTERIGEFRDVERGEMVCRDALVEFVPGHRGDEFIGQAETLQNRDGWQRRWVQHRFT
jgi:hypothetical protein